MARDIIFSAMYGVSAPIDLAITYNTSPCTAMAASISSVVRARRLRNATGTPRSARTGNIQPRTDVDGASAAPLDRTSCAHRPLPAACTMATIASGASDTTSVLTRDRHGHSCRIRTSPRNVNNGGPIQTGQVRNTPTAVPLTTAAAVSEGSSSHAVTPHQNATAKSAETACARNESWTNASATYPRTPAASRTPDSAIEIRDGVAGSTRMTIRNTNPIVSAALRETTTKIA